jgi:PAS domain S-box-containing protein
MDRGGGQAKTGNPPDRFRELLEAAPDAILEVDRDGRITLVNRAAESVFGYSRDELLGHPVELLLPEDLRAAHAHHRSGYAEQPKRRPMNTGLALEGRRKDGARFPAEISLSPAVSEDGFRVTAIVRDVTERKRAGERLRSIQERRACNLAASNRELERRNQEIELANYRKDEFFRSMSHELRTPLHTVIGFSELLAEQTDGPLNPRQQRMVDQVRRDALHLLELVNEVLDLSRFENGPPQLRPETFDLAGPLEETAASVRPWGWAKSVAITTRVEAPRSVHTDRLRLKQILYNLLSNAVKFTPEGGRVAVEALRRGEWMEIAVIDNGIGIPREEQAAVFEMFYQARHSAGVPGGSGLGLSITKQLVEEQGGRLWLDSELGKGSRFSITLPVPDEA